ncbi:uncharacterized protein G6M90_00g084430 [Metarhizium brunneum]|uniref:PA14 domain-containing protein n=1 Tax=Metarhizium brunneum TaxID=500148 RepID=A0A7D5ZAA9_9HYPO
MRSLGVVTVFLLGLLSQEVSAGSSVAQINLLAAPQSRGTLAYVRDSAPPEFTYTTDYAQSGNWIGLFEKGMGPDTGGDDKYLGWASAPASKGRVTADADFDQCLPAGQYDAYLFRQRGPRSYPVVGPVTFSYPGNPDYHECEGGICKPAAESCSCADGKWWCPARDECIPTTKQCRGKCPKGWRVAGNSCVQDICENPLAGVQWDAYRMSIGNGLGQIPYPEPAPFLPQFNIDTLFGGTPVQPTSGTVGSIGWRNGVAWITNQVLQPIPQDYFFMSWTGYLVPKHTGSYTFNMWWTDDVSYLWVGEHARSEFSESNADLKVDYASIDTFGKKRFSYSAEQGKPVPIRVINVQAAGPYSLCFGVTDPTGQAVMNTCGEGGVLRESDGQIAYCKDVKFGSVFRHVPVKRAFTPDMPSSRCTNLKSGAQWNLYKFQPGSGPGHISYTSAQPLLPAHSIDMVLAATPNARYTGQVDKIGWDSGYVEGVGSIYPPADTGPRGYFLMFWTSYLVPSREGSYRFDVWWVDDVAFLWVGNKAIADFSETNADLKVDYAFLDVFGKKYFEYHVKAEDVGKRIPIRVANIQGGGAFSVFMMVTDPTGKVIMNSGDRGSGKLPQASNGEIGYCP